MSVADNLAQVREQIAVAAATAGRTNSEVTLVAVCKRQPIERIFAAYDAGARDFGESTVQGLCTTADALRGSGREVRWHFIGRLQRNKLNKLIPHRPLIHTVDGEGLAKSIGVRSSEPTEVLVQVNIGNEQQKGGVASENALLLARAVSKMPGLRLRGLMGMPPYSEDPRPYFEEMAKLSAQLRKLTGSEDAAELSMGMTDDFTVAIQCGATMVRVGTAIFGVRD
ncbi:MAG: YggS family pyridoxal phosphate enzyme [Deltaproteobacteria bacterium RIFOXYA12_FULL_58_15]|nr:MAG: YggS family pyridoxal phosphate enzyme [Deltaproteobacteria bacterium RIFOXYA12_FULL_58_15]OGR13866.1 MAG: YggS family pyridoxal phosphate enzyme [Deltaproteobacteria bacterium RIFOXYB12_FULL_58_9]